MTHVRVSAPAASATRPAAVAGTFYPGEADELGRDVDAMLKTAASAVVPGEPLPKAVVVPHAGFVYSGPIAASAYARLFAARGVVTRVVIVGPCHRVAVRGMAAPASDAFATPLGEVAIDQAAVAALERAGLPVERSDRAHAREHALEVQLPFLQRVLGSGFSVVPLAVGDCAPADVARALELLWGGPETLIVISTDLSHYLPYATAKTVDLDTAERVARLAPEPIAHEEACGATGLEAIVAVARARRLRAALLDLRNSGDTRGPRDGVVGYASFAFYEEGQ